MKTLLVYNRPFTASFMSQYRKLFGGTYNILYISDFKYRDDVGLIQRQYHHLAHSDVDADRGLDYSVISRRCRYLRVLDERLGRRLINSAWLAIQDIFQRHEPDAFIGLPMDNYYLDLIDQYCVGRGIFTVNPVQSFLPGRTRICRRGEYVHVRDVGSDEIAHYRDLLLRKNFRPTWLSKHRGRGKLMKMYAREVGKKIFFAGAKIVKRDPYSFHYNGVYPHAPAVNTSSRDLLKIENLFVRDLAALEAEAGNYPRVVFLPLQFSPESSLDYNIPDSRFSMYNKMLDMVLGNIPADTLLIVKEHPDMYGYRTYDFYQQFLSRPNVRLVDVRVTVQQLFALSDFILVTGAASTGAEAIIKGKTVISLGGGTFYGVGGGVHEIENFDDVPRWSDWMRPIHNDDSKLNEVMRLMLTNTLVGPYDFVRTPAAKIPEARENIKTIVDYVTSMLAPAEQQAVAL